MSPRAARAGSEAAKAHPPRHGEGGRNGALPHSFRAGEGEVREQERNRGLSVPRDLMRPVEPRSRCSSHQANPISGPRMAVVRDRAASLRS